MIFEPEAWTKGLIERLISSAVPCELTRASAALVCSGREDLLENSGELHRVLAEIPAPERRPMWPV
jgi:hypothetical protein